MNQETPREGELELIQWIRRQKQMPPEVIVGPGDDAAGLMLPPYEMCLVTTDSVVEGVHYDPRQATPRQIGHKSVARALSDLAAMAAHAVAVVSALRLPRSAGLDFAKEVVQGQLDLCGRLGVAMAGGDVAVGDGPLAVTVTAIGTAPPEKAALRSGAKKGDILCVTGELGGAHLGRSLDFTPRLAEAQWIAKHARVHAMIDISDGLARDAMHLAKESHVGICIDPVALPIAPAAHEAARRSGRTATQHALADGEDYELLFCLSRRAAKALLARPDPPVRILAIGKVFEEPGLWMLEEGGGRVALEPLGWEHRFCD